MTKPDRDRENFNYEPEQDPNFKLLVRESEKILENPEEVYDLAGKRLALRGLQLKEHFSKPENTVRFAVVGNSNLGKTTYSYTVAQILDLYSIPVNYVDLDLHTQSGLAMAGVTNSWVTTRAEIPEDEINKSIKDFAQSGPGIVLGDFPGRLENPHQVNRLKTSSLALIFALNLKERDEWAELCDKAGVGFRWVISRRSTSLQGPLYPQTVGLERRVIFSASILASATSIVEEAAQITNAPKSTYQNFFSQPELVVLEEVLDFLYSIQMP